MLGCMSTYLNHSQALNMTPGLASMTSQNIGFLSLSNRKWINYLSSSSSVAAAKQPFECWLMQYNLYFPLVRLYEINDELQTFVRKVHEKRDLFCHKKCWLGGMVMYGSTCRTYSGGRHSSLDSSAHHHAILLSRVCIPSTPSVLFSQILNYICHCIKKKTKINKKRTGWFKFKNICHF